MKYLDLLNKMTLEEKALFLSGYTNMATTPIERLHLPSLIMSDGPNGLRIENAEGNSMDGISKTLPATCFPSGVNIASSWNKNLIEKIGIAIGEECNHYGVNVVLGPAINIKRNPLAGRNFEYYSEDPFLAGNLASSFVKGVQSQKVGCCLKHFACNNKESFRFVSDSIVDPRALHEIYLKPFEIAVKKSKPLAIMSAYNKINGIHCSENYYLQEEILRKKWKFDGYCVTDWGGITTREKGLIGGTDLEMPGQVKHSANELINAVNEGRLKEEDINKSVARLLKTLDKTYKEKIPCDFNSHYDLAVKLVEESAVLLKNESLLPLNINEKFTVIGDFFEHVRYQGSGSALLNPYINFSHKEFFDKQKIKYDYIRGFKEEEDEPNLELEEEVINFIKDRNETILFFGGLNDYVESEGFDRENMNMPSNQISLLKRIISLGKKVVFVLHNGSSISEPILNNCSSILDLFLGGEGTAQGCFNILFGKVSPSGKLAETWVKDYSCVPFNNEIYKNKNEVYKESIFVGYRYYLSNLDKIEYPFGFGLSYTKFVYSDIKVKMDDNKIFISYIVKNVGQKAGSEISQVYVSHKSSLPIPLRELKGFDKTYLDAGESKEITVEINVDDLKIYDVSSNDFVLEEGKYIFEVGSSSIDIRLNDCLEIKGEKIINKYSDNLLNHYLNLDKLDCLEDRVFEELLGYKIEYPVKSKKITWETPIADFHGFFANIFAHAVSNVGLKRFKKACKMKDGPEKEREKKAGLFVYKLMPNNSLRSLCYSSSGSLPYNIARGILEMCNNHYIKGIKEMLRKDK